MKRDMTINIDDYLSEEDKIEISKNLFKEELRSGFLKLEKHKIIDNYERVITNAVYRFLEEEVDSILGTDHKLLIEKSLKKVLNKDLTYTVFRSPSLWGDKKSRAQEILDSALEKNKDIAIKKCKEALENLNTSNVEDYFVDVMKEVILEKIKK